MSEPRDHGGGLDAAVAQYGGVRGDWIDLSTGINPVPYPLGDVSAAWTALPDQAAHDRLLAAARAFWNVPDGARIIAAPGASVLIAQMPTLFRGHVASIPQRTYNEHAAAFRHHNWSVMAAGTADVHVRVHPNNPDGQVLADPGDIGNLVIDESFCDTMPAQSFVRDCTRTDRIVLKSFGKFWGLAGLRLGFAIAHPSVIAELTGALGPWAVSGPALEIGAMALEDTGWANTTRARLEQDAARLDRLMAEAGATVTGGTTLFRLYDVGDAQKWQDILAQSHIWSRIFPYSKGWLRLGLPAPQQWSHLEATLRGMAGGAMGANPSVTRQAPQ